MSRIMTKQMIMEFLTVVLQTIWLLAGSTTFTDGIMISRSGKE